jgi:GntR family transcriptional repressor for pyruvate dehydrogenase complex
MEERILAAKRLPLKPIRRVLVSDELIEQFKNLILEGTLKPGDGLGSETNLAAQMKVGRSTIREALKVLIHLGFIERKGKVTVVAEGVSGGMQPRDIIERFRANRNFLEMIEVLKIIEPDIAAMAATRHEAGDLDLIRQSVDAMKETLGDLNAFLNHDYNFHLHIAQASRNQILIEIIRGIQDILKKTQAYVLRESDSIHQRSLGFHTKIFKAIKNGQAELAEKCMYDHIEDIEGEMYTILKQKNRDEKIPG